MNIHIQFFGPLTEICDHLDMTVDAGTDKDTLIQTLKLRYPLLKTAVFATAINNRLIQENLQLRENDIVSLLPPFSGG